MEGWIIVGKGKKCGKDGKVFLSFMDIWLACCGDKDYIYKVIRHYEEDVENCVFNRSTGIGVRLSKEDREDCRQEVYMAMLRAMKRFRIF